MQIRRLLDKIDEDQLFIPAFQREYVWKRQDVRSLFNSLLKEYPTGNLLTWETNNPPELKGNKVYEKSWGSIKLILDGQQRITSLYLIIRGEIPPYYEEKDITQNTRGLHVNLSNLELKYSPKAKMENNSFWINLTEIFKGKIDPFDFVEKLESDDVELDKEERRQIQKNFRKVENILDFDFKEQTIPIKASIR